MKKLGYLAVLGLLSCLRLQGQITITNSDLPNAQDTIRLSVTTTLAGFQPGATGANHTWDYTFLLPDSQRVVKCESPSNTAYPLYTFLATYGIYNHNPDQFPFVLMGTPPEDVYDFYKKTSSSLAIVGQGITVAGNTLPAIYSVADKVYSLPLNYGNKDSSTSTLSFPIPGIGYYEKKQVRRNQVDGWGTLQTPYGTFNTLRIKTTLMITDSIYLDTIQFGFSLPRQTLHEYKWLAPGGKLPILQIDATESFQGTLSVDRVNWRDSVINDLSVALLAKPSCRASTDGSVTATISGGRYPLKYLWSTGDTTASIMNVPAGSYTLYVTDRYDQRDTAVAVVEERVADASCLNIPTAFTPDGDGTNDVWNIRSLADFSECKVEIFNQWGSLIYRSKGYNAPWDGRYNGEPAPAGTYYYVINLGNGSKSFTGYVTIIR